MFAFGLVTIGVGIFILVRINKRHGKEWTKQGLNKKQKEETNLF